MLLNKIFEATINWMRIARSLFLLSVLAFPLIAMAETEFKIIDLQHHFAEDILPTIQSLIGTDGVVTGMQNHLIVRASPEKMREIEKVIAKLDVASQNLKITVRLQNDLQTLHDDIEVSGRKRSGNVEIATDKYPRSASDGVQVSVEKNKRKSRGSSTQFINVIDGELAFIRVGQSVPFSQEWVVLTRRYVSTQQTSEFVDISTGFAVRPRSIGDQIDLEIKPRIAQLNQYGFIDFEELSTIVRVNKGEWLDLGGIMQKKDEVSRMILSKQSNVQSQNNGLSIRVD
jgi:hypothetical protein